MENLTQFKQRINVFIWNSIPQDKLETSKGLCGKINGCGEPIPFFGNTIVFPLENAIKKQLADLQSQLYDACGEMLAYPLLKDSFHITLHDLLSSTDSVILNEASDMRKPALKLCKEISNENHVICLRSTAMFNMVNTSIVLGFEPVDEEGCGALMESYEKLQKLVRLDYPLTPHVTMAYFKPGVYYANQLNNLKSVIDKINGYEKLDVILNTGVIEYQEFASMTEYYTFR